MNLFNKLPGYRRSASGLELTLWRRLPAILLWGTLLPLLVLAVRWWMLPGSAGSDDRGWLLEAYTLIGVVVLHWTLVLTVAVGCAIVLIMKGPAYVADPYPPEGRDALSDD
jgi:hypothetical protein